MVESKAIPKKITNQDVEEMIAGIQFNYILREGLCGADLSECDMSELDFEHFKLLCYDESTHFSDKQIKRFNPMKLLELAKLPMESLREVHSKGINASGVKVAIIDTNIEQNNIRDLYGGRVEYVESQYEGEIEPHGATVLDSFMQIAPNAEVQYYPLDKKDKVNKANHLFEYIKQSTQSGVKVISLSNDLENIMGDRIDEVRDYLDTNGVTLIDSPTFYRDFTYCFRDIQFDGAETYKKCLCEPEDSSHRNFWNKIVSMYQSKLKEYNLSNIADLKKQLEEKGETELLRRIIEFEPILQFEEFSEGKNSPLHFLKQREKSNELSKRNTNVEVPCGGRTLDGKYWGTSSASYTIPVIAGMFAMCKQITPQIEYEDFVTLCKETSQIIDGCNLIQPQILMDKVREKATNVEKISQTEIEGFVPRQLSDAQNIQEIDKKKKQILQKQREIYQGDLEKEDNNGDIKTINIEQLSYEELDKMCFHYSLKKDKNSIQKTGLSARVGRNSEGIDKFKSIYFSYGIEAVLETWDVWLKWRANRLYHPYWQEENKDIQQAIENGTATEQEKREYYYKCQEWNESFSSGKYKEDTEKIKFLYDFQIDEMLASNYYILDLKEGEDFTFDEIDVKKAPLINMDRNSISYKISNHMLGNYTDFESAKVDKWNMNTILGKELTIEPARIKQVCLANGKNDVLSIVTFLYDKYKEIAPKDEQVQFDLLDGYMEYVKDKIKNNELPYFNRNDRIDEHDILAYFHSQKTENDFKDETVSFGFTEQRIGKATVLKSKETPAESAQEEVKLKKRINSDMREVEQMKEVDENSSNNTFPEGQDE